jgi:beta-lysine 5,6-aminomutase beta subunit
MALVGPPGGRDTMSGSAQRARRVRAYGDRWNDGVVQLSFTLPVSHGALAVEAARRYVVGMGFSDPYVAFAQPVSPDFTFFVVYGKSLSEVDLGDVRADEAAAPHLSREEIDAEVERRFGARLVVLGCALETDAHTVGLDAIFNPKGFAGDPGLERYRGFDARNLGAQVPIDRLVRLARESNADAVLVSATVTQNEIHVRHLTDLVDVLEAEGLRDRLVLLAGGARVDHALAKELGYDGGFGPGTTASRVAAFLLEEISRRRDP